MVEKLQKGCYILPSFKNINTNVLTVQFQVINNTTRLLDFWHPVAGLGEQTQKIQI